MAIYFSNSDLKKLSSEQFSAIGKIADAVGARTVDEPDEQSSEDIAAYCKQYQAKAQAEALAQQALINSLV